MLELLVRSCDRFDAREDVVEDKNRTPDIQETILEMLESDCLKEEELQESLTQWYHFTKEEVTTCLNVLVTRGLIIRDGDYITLALIEHQPAEIERPAA
jgi:hypothetical protein